jgi:flavodoxin
MSECSNIEGRTTMKALVVYESIFGNTMEIAEAIARGLSARFEVTATEVGEADTNIGDIDLLVVGGPTHVWGMSRGLSRKGALEQAAKIGVRPVSPEMSIRMWTHLLPNTHMTVLAATFDTALKKGRWFPTGSAARSADSQLRKKGFESVVKPQQFYVTDTVGPLADDEVERAVEWGMKLGEVAERTLSPRREAVGAH